MSYNFNVRVHPEQLEACKFVELKDDSRYPAVSTTYWEYRDSAPALSSVKIFPKYAVLTYSAGGMGGNGPGGSFTQCETRTSGNPSFVSSRIFIHNSVNQDALVKVTLISGLSCAISVGKSSEVNHTYTENLAVSAVNDYSGCSINFYS